MLSSVLNKLHHPSDSVGERLMSEWLLVWFQAASYLQLQIYLITSDCTWCASAFEYLMILKMNCLKRLSWIVEHKSDSTRRIALKNYLNSMFVKSWNSYSLWMNTHFNILTSKMVHRIRSINLVLPLESSQNSFSRTYDIVWKSWISHSLQVK